MKQAAKPDSHPFQGVIIEAITPRRPNETSVDLSATLEMVDFLSESGANAIALLGSTGEFVHFSVDDRCHMTDFAVKRSRVPVLVNVSHSTLDGAVELADEAVDSNVVGLLLMPPYYFRYSQQAIRKFYLDFAKSISGPVPIFLYNIPVFTNELEIATALSLLETGLFAGIKDSSGSWDYFMRLRDHATKYSYTILIGDDSLFARARACGAHGVVSGTASAVPELMLAIERAVVSEQPDLVRALDGRLREFIDQISKFPAPMGIKEAAGLRRVKLGVPAIHLSGEEQEQMDRFLAWFEPWLATVRTECNLNSKTGRSGER